MNFTKKELLEQLRNEKALAMAIIDNSNLSKKLKQIDYEYDVVDTWFSNDILFDITITENGFSECGDICEIGYNHSKGNYITKKHGKGQKDTKNYVYHELKTIINPSGACDFKCIENMNDNEGFVLMLYSGIYQFKVKDLAPYKDMYRITYDKDGKKHIRIGLQKIKYLINIKVITKRENETELWGITRELKGVKY